METVVVGIDVLKDRLDVHVLPAGEAFAVARDAAGLEALARRLVPLAPPQRLVDAGKPKRVAPIAVARKLLTILNAIIRDRTPWQPA